MAQKKSNTKEIIIGSLPTLPISKVYFQVVIIYH